MAVAMTNHQRQSDNEYDILSVIEKKPDSSQREIAKEIGVRSIALIGEGENTQLSMSWRTLDEKFVEEEYCQKCDTNKLRTELRVLVQKVLGTNMRLRNKEKFASDDRWV